MYMLVCCAAILKKNLLILKYFLRLELEVI